MKPSKEEINNEIKALIELKPKVRKFTTFGDDNHLALDASVNVLENELNEDAIYEIYGNIENPEKSQYIVENAISTMQWMNGEGIESPSKSFSTCIQ
jgi:hypothetical protein